MKRELDKAIGATSYFLAGTFMLQLLADKTFDSVPSRVKVAIEYSGWGRMDLVDTKVR